MKTPSDTAHASLPAAGSHASAVDTPLTLTIHDMPGQDGSKIELSGGSDAASSAHRSRSGRLKMLLVVMVCAAPVIASYFTFYVLRPEGRQNYGSLVQQRAVPAELVGRRVDGRLAPFSELKNQWLLVSVGSSDCDATCEKRLYLQRQLRESLGREKDRLDWVWLVTDDRPFSTKLASALKGANVWRVDPKSLGDWLSAEDGRALQDHFYVVDPMGNWMMRFPADLDWGKTKRDIERLLRASKHWDQAGRPDREPRKDPFRLPTSAASAP